MNRCNEPMIPDSEPASPGRACSHRDTMSRKCAASWLLPLSSCSGSRLLRRCCRGATMRNCRPAAGAMARTTAQCRWEWPSRRCPATGSQSPIIARAILFLRLFFSRAFWLRGRRALPPAADLATYIRPTKRCGRSPSPISLRAGLPPPAEPKLTVKVVQDGPVCPQARLCPFARRPSL